MALIDEVMRATAGAEFRRADLHVHSFGEDGSYDVTDPAMTPEAIVDTAEREGLQVVSVTDHNAIGNVRRAVRHAAGKNLLVVPGVELSTPQGHLLVYCPTERQLEQFVGKLTITSDRKACADPIVACLKLAAEFGGFGVPAHIDLSSGFDQMMPKFDPFKEEVLKCRNLLALEVSNAVNEPWYTERDAHPDRKRLARLRRDHLDEEDGYELAKVMGSDAHKLSALGRNAAGARKLTRLKMESLTFDALRIALLDPCARTRIEDLVPAATPRFVGMKLEGGFLNNQVVRFSKNLTCIIGGRGTGKSTMLESLRATSGNTARPGAVDSEVWPDRITLVYEDEAGRRQILVRDRLRDVVNETDPDGPTYAPIESYGQGETAATIQHCDKDPAILLRFLDGFVEPSTLAAADDGVCQALLENEDLVAQLRREVGTTKAVERAKHAAEGKLAALKEKNAAEVVDLESKLAKERSFRKHLTQQLRQVAATVRESLAGADVLDQVLATDGGTLVVGAAEFASVMALVRGYADRIRGISSDLQAESGKVMGSLNEQLREWERKENQTQGRIDDIRRDLEAKGVRLDLAAIRRVAQEATDYSQRLIDLRAKAVQLVDAQKARAALVTDRRAIKAKAFAARQRFAAELNRQLGATITDYAVTLKFREGLLSAALEELLKAAMDWRTSRVPKARVIASQVSPLSLAAAIATGDRAVLAGVKGEDGAALLNAADVDAMHATLSRPEHLCALQCCPFEDLPELKISRETPAPPGGRPGRLVREFAQLSLGQQQSLLLSIMLFSKSPHPLVIDQPEDNLDSEFIYKTFVKTLRTVKERRQVIVVTHNANIAVLGDAELILALKSSHDCAVVAERGSIDTPATKAIACAILEGSEQAFKKRHRIYGH